MNIEMLLEFHSHPDVPIPAGAAATITVTARRRCVPLRLRADVDTAARFRILRIDAGVEPLEVARGGRTFEELEAGGFLRLTFLEAGMDLRVEVSNVSDEQAHFVGEMWGLFEMPETRWRVVGLDDLTRELEEHEPLWRFECVAHGHVSRPTFGSSAPGWCVECLRLLVSAYAPTSTDGGS